MNRLCLVERFIALLTLIHWIVIYPVNSGSNFIPGNLLQPFPYYTQPSRIGRGAELRVLMHFNFPKKNDLFFKSLSTFSLQIT